MPDPVSQKTLKEAEKRATIRQFFYRQLFITPGLPGKNISLRGKIAIVTGSNTGIGLECARQLLDLGLGKLIIAVRNKSKGDVARKDLSSGRQLEENAIEVWDLDMLSYDSIMAFIERTRTLQRLDIVILNVGIMKQTYSVASTGHEETIQVNYLSTALLTILLLPILKLNSDEGTKESTAPSRIVWVQSDMASWAKFKEKTVTSNLLPTLDKSENFKLPDRYSTSKLLGQLFVNTFTKKTPPSVAIITMPNPGLCYKTGLGVETRGIAEMIAGWIKRIFGRSASVGARAVIDAAVNHGAEAHGEYLEDCKTQPYVNPFKFHELIC